MKQEKGGGERSENDFVVFCFSLAIRFISPVRGRVLVVPVWIVSGVGVGKDATRFVSLSLSERKLAGAA